MDAQSVLKINATTSSFTDVLTHELLCYFKIDNAGCLTVSIEGEADFSLFDICIYVFRNDLRIHSTPYLNGITDHQIYISQSGAYTARIFIKRHQSHWSSSEMYVFDPIKWNSHPFLKISIIIPVFNRSSVLGECLNSIYQQSMPENQFEILVIDDCSTDNISHLIDKFSESHKNIKYIRLPYNTGGASIPRNVGLDIAKGEYVFFLDSDYSIVSKSMLDDSYQLCTDQILDVCLVYGYRNVRASSPRPIGKYRLRQPIIDCLNLYKRSSLLSINPRFYDFMGSEDVIFTLQFIFNLESLRVNWLPGLLITERRDIRVGSPRSATKWREMVESFIDVSFAQLKTKPFLADGVYYAFSTFIALLPHIEILYRKSEQLPLNTPVNNLSYVSEYVFKYVSEYINHRIPIGVEVCVDVPMRKLFELFRTGNREQIIGYLANQSEI